ncbi:MAG: SDR family NAD(P)-dependent oxidoreductase, partial [Verrucomicrobia bacterium]|nr:SDR family NAD(P)-dependent oxidoreductase [Verrucomicrobiota bacterium]
MSERIGSLLGELDAPAGSSLHRGGVRHLLQIVGHRADSHGKSRLREGGVYLITGGLGGLGRLLSSHLARRYRARLILLGRSPLDAHRETFLQELQALGAGARYEQADVADADGLADCLARLRVEWGPLNGVFHLAGLESERMLADKEWEDFARTLRPKIEGTRLLDELTAAEPLDFFCTFSSSSAVLGDLGGCDYSVGNRFQMTWCARRNRLVRAGARHGHSLALLWPLWREGGMGLRDPEAARLYLASSGQRLLEAQEALPLLEELLGGNLDHALVLCGDETRIKQFLGRARSGAQPAGDELYRRVEADLKRRIQELLKLEPERVDPDENLSAFGFDSMRLAEFARVLNRAYGLDLTPAVFFGSSTVSKLARFLVEQRGAAMSRYFAGAAPAERTPELIAVEPAPTPTRPAVEAIRSRHPIQSRVAIIGCAGRMPQSRDLDDFWAKLKSGHSFITGLPPERSGWLTRVPSEGNLPPQAGSKWGAFIDGVDQFDPLFFGISPKEAAMMDPQQRLLLMLVWQALEDAGYRPGALAGSRTAVFVAAERSEYQSVSGVGADDAAYAVLGQHLALLANRISNYFDFRGPSELVNTACSSGAVAIHRAIQALRHGEAEAAVVCASNLMLRPDGFEVLTRMGMVCGSTEVKSFGAGASGYVRGEGVGVVVLKPLDRAVQAGDPIRAVILGSAVNHNGRGVSLTAPDREAQAAVIRGCYREAGIDPRTVSYIEAQATGSELGDAIEIDAYLEAFAQLAPDAKPGSCAVSTLKPDLGHLEGASAFAALFRILGALRYGEIPGIRGLQALNPHLRLEGTPFRLVRAAESWTPRRGADGVALPRRAALHSYGFGGVNAHLLIEEFRPAPVPPEADGGEELVVLSAATLASLRHQAARLKEWLERHPTESLSDVAHTLRVAREAFRERAAFVANSRGDWLRQLGALASGEAVAPPEGESESARLAREWLRGASVSWPAPNPGRSPRRVALPGYVFDLRRCWMEPRERERASSPASAYYDQAIQRGIGVSAAGLPAQEVYLTFAPFPERRPGFSWTRVALNPDAHHEEAEYVLARQREMREALFAGVDFSGAAALLDIGCGHGTDLLRFAAQHPGLRADGFTISEEQHRLVHGRIAAAGLDGRVRVFLGDSAAAAFPGRYDVILGIEVLCHIRNKPGIFDNIARSLAGGGVLLLSDFVANLRGAIVDPAIDSAISTEAEWIELLSGRGLAIESLTDVSREIGNFMADEELERNLAGQPEIVAKSFRAWANASIALARGWTSYCLMRICRDTRGRTEDQLREWNLGKFRAKQPYARARQGIGSGAVAPSEARRPDLASVRAVLDEIFTRTLGLSAGDLKPLPGMVRLGVSSLNAVELLEAINCRFNTTFPTSLLFDCDTIETLARQIQPRLLAASPSEAESWRAPAPAAVMAAKQEPTPSPDANARRGIIEPDTIEEPIAIIGMACRCAGADDLDAFWRLVREGRDEVREIVRPGWREAFEAPGPEGEPNLSVSKWGGFLADLDSFDNAFFRISPAEAASMHPEHRLLLEEIYKAIQDAGYSEEAMASRTCGTFIGAMSTEIVPRNDLSHFAMLGHEPSILAARMAHYLDLKGPALTVNTACSSSLVALELACEKLLGGSVDLAIVGGITLYTDPAAYVLMSRAKMLSPTGRCRPFDDGADGIVCGEGVGVVIGKRLSDAERDGDRIYGIIRAIGTNQDGRTAGITVPSFSAQSALEQAVYRRAGVSPETFQCVEAHGTGTKLGDPVEIHALTEAFRAFTGRKAFCAIGSLKANIGHTTAAAGVLGLIKVLLAMRHGEIPPLIHCESGNGHIRFEDGPFVLPREVLPWPRPETSPRRAAVSSFGYSGTNAHLVVEEYLPAGQPSGLEGPRPVLVAWSAKTKDALERLTGRLAAWLGRERREASLDSIAGTLNLGRSHFAFRAAAVAESVEDLGQLLEAMTAGRRPENTLEGNGAEPSLEDRAVLAELSARLHEELAANPAWEPAVRRRKFTALAAIYVKGLEVNWQLVQPRGTVCRVSLPTYPFARKTAPAPEPVRQRDSLFELALAAVDPVRRET